MAAVVGLRAARRARDAKRVWANVDAVLPGPVKSEEDGRTYRAVRLVNGLRVVLVSDMASTRAAAAMSVAVGHYSDPVDLCGLAHFLEHMLFLGTERFPDEAEYKRYLSEHGGRSNASTNTERTLFHFELDGRELAVVEGGLDRFSQFFVAPKMSEACVERELGAIDNEFQLKYESDSRRFYQALKSSADVDLLDPSGRGARLSHVPWTAGAEGRRRPRHPVYKMSCGNTSTLRDLPAQTTPPIDVRARLTQFWREHYSATTMVLCVSAPHSLDTLQAMVAAQSRFAGIPRRAIAPPRSQYAALPHPFDYRAIRARECEGAGGGAGEGARVPRRCVLLELRPVKQTRTLCLLWPTPPGRTRHAARPWGDVVTHLLGHEGEGSLFAALKRKSLATALSAGHRQDASCFALVQIKITLTDAADGEALPGAAAGDAAAVEARRASQRREIIRIVFAYLYTLRTADAPSLARIALEVARNRARRFRFKKKGTVSGAVRAIAAKLTYLDYPFATRDVLSGGCHGEGAVQATPPRGVPARARGAPAPRVYRPAPALGEWSDVDDAAFRAAVARFTPLGLVVHHASPHFGAAGGAPGGGDGAAPEVWREEHWYKTQHRVRLLPSSDIDVWEAALAGGSSRNGMHLPRPNALIPTDFTVLGASAGSRGGSRSSSARAQGVRRASELPCAFRPSPPKSGSATPPRVLVDVDSAPLPRAAAAAASDARALTLFRAYDASRSEGPQAGGGDEALEDAEEVRQFAREMERASSRLWYKLDRTFLRPTALISVKVIAPVAWRTSVAIVASARGAATPPSSETIAAVRDICSASGDGPGSGPESSGILARHSIDVGAAVWSVVAKLFRRLVADAMTQFSYDAKLAGMRWSAGAFSISVAGFSDRLLVLLRKVLDECTPIAVAARLRAAQRALDCGEGGGAAPAPGALDAQRRASERGELYRFRRVHEKVVRGLQNWSKQRPLTHATEFVDVVLRSAEHLNSNAAHMDVAACFAERPGAAALLIDAMYQRQRAGARADGAEAAAAGEEGEHGEDAALYASTYGALVETVVGGNLSAAGARRAQEMVLRALRPLPLLPALRLERKSSGRFEAEALGEAEREREIAIEIERDAPLPVFELQPQWEGSGIVWLDRPQPPQSESSSAALDEAFEMADVMGGRSSHHLLDGESSRDGESSGGGGRGGLGRLGRRAKSTTSSRLGSRGGGSSRGGSFATSRLSIATVGSSSASTATAVAAPGSVPGSAPESARATQMAVAPEGGESASDDDGSFYTAESAPTIETASLASAIDRESRGREDAAASAAERCAVDETIVFARAPNEQDLNSAIVNVYQLPRAQAGYEERESALLSLLCHVMHQPAFSALRTERQLGYIVRTRKRVFSGICLAVERLGTAHLSPSASSESSASASPLLLPGIGVLALQIAIQSKTHAPPALNREIEAFLVAFGGTLRGRLEATRAGDASVAQAFATQRESLAQLLVKPPDSFEGEFYEHCGQVGAQTRCFARAAQQAAAVRRLELAELVAFFERCVCPAPLTALGGSAGAGGAAPAGAAAAAVARAAHGDSAASAAAEAGGAVWAELTRRRVAAKLSVQVFGAKHAIPAHCSAPGGVQTMLREHGAVRVRYVSLSDVVAFKEARPEWPMRPHNI